MAGVRVALIAAGAALRVSAGRSFRRAGEEFGAEPKILPVEDLDEAALATILAEPMLVIDAGTDGSDWRRLSDEERAEFVAALEGNELPVTPEPVSIDFNATEAVFVRAGVSTLAELTDRVETLISIEGAYHADQRHIFDQGFQSLGELIAAWEDDRAELTALKASAEQNSMADRQGGAPVEVAPLPAGGGEGQGAAGGDQSAAPADQSKETVPAGKAKPARKASAKPEGK